MKRYIEDTHLGARYRRSAALRDLQRTSHRVERLKCAACEDEERWGAVGDLPEDATQEMDGLLEK